MEKLDAKDENKKLMIDVKDDLVGLLKVGSGVTYYKPMRHRTTPSDTLRLTSSKDDKRKRFIGRKRVLELWRRKLTDDG